MSDKAYKHNKTGKIAYFNDEAIKYVSNFYTEASEDDLAAAEKEGNTPTASVAKKKAVAPAEDDAELQAARAEYEQVTGEKPGNRKLETLRKEIEEANANK